MRITGRQFLNVDHADLSFSFVYFVVSVQKKFRLYARRDPNH